MVGALTTYWASAWFGARVAHWRSLKCPQKDASKQSKEEERTAAVGAAAQPTTELQSRSSSILALVSVCTVVQAAGHRKTRLLEM